MDKDIKLELIEIIKRAILSNKSIIRNIKIDVTINNEDDICSYSNLPSPNWYKKR